MITTQQLLKKLPLLSPILNPELRTGLGLLIDGAVPDSTKILAGLALLLLAGAVALTGFLRRGAPSARLQ